VAVGDGDFDKFYSTGRTVVGEDQSGRSDSNSEVSICTFDP
jgi:hypothetical protein